jgi:hypothetical protein
MILKGSDDTVETCTAETLDDTTSKESIVCLSRGCDDDTDDDDPCGDNENASFTPYMNDNDDDGSDTSDNE